MSLIRERPVSFQLTVVSYQKCSSRSPDFGGCSFERSPDLIESLFNAFSRTRLLPLDHRVRTDRADHKSWAARERGHHTAVTWRAEGHVTSPAGQRAGCTLLYFMQTTVRHPGQNRLDRISPKFCQFKCSFHWVSPYIKIVLPHFSAPLATGVRTTTSTIALPSHSELQHYDSSPTRMCLQSSNQPPPELHQPSQSLAAC